MSSVNGFVESAFQNRFLVLGGAAALAVGYIGASKAAIDHRKEPLPDRLTAASLAGGRAMAGAGLVAGMGALAYRNRGPVAGTARSAADFASRETKGFFRRLDANRTAYLASRGSSEFGDHLAAVTQTYGRSGAFMAGTGAVVGGLIGSSYGRPGTGMAIGAGVGLAAKAAIGGYDLWGKASKIPFARTAIIGSLSTMIFAGALAMAPREYQAEMDAVPDGSGGYDLAPTGVKDRLATLSADGSMVFGLNNGRHG